MIVTMSEEYAKNVGGAMVHRAAEVLAATGIVPAWVEQFADLWDNHGVRYGSDPFWEAVLAHDKHNPILRRLLTPLIERTTRG